MWLRIVPNIKETFQEWESSDPNRYIAQRELQDEIQLMNPAMGKSLISPVIKSIHLKCSNFLFIELAYIVRTVTV